MSRSGHLFADGDLSATLRARTQALAQAAQAIPADHAIARSAEELAAELVEQFHIEPLVMDGEAMTVPHEDTRVDVRYDPVRAILDQSRPVYVPGTRITYHVPVSGEMDLLKLRPSHYALSSPIAEVSGSEVRISETAPAPVPESIKGRLDKTLREIKGYVERANADVATFNADLPASALAGAEQRRQKVIADQDLVASFGVPVRRTDAPKTYAAPPKRRKIPSAAAKRSMARLMEPTLPAEVYEHILSIARQMVTVMERSPRSFATMAEEDIRQHFLVQLNGQYEGDATGETFNFEGKTDILIRQAGRTMFIAECKFWRGPKGLIETVDQLLSYTSWRDTKTAIFLFNRNKDLSKVLGRISSNVAGHSNFVREIAPYGSETDFRFVLHHRDDSERELTLTILVFEVPA